MRKQKQPLLQNKWFSFLLICLFLFFCGIGLIGMSYLFLVAFGTQNQLLIVLSLGIFLVALFGGIYYLYQIFCEF